MRKNTILFALVSLLSFSLFGQDCPPSGIMLSSQSAVDSFAIKYPNCTDLPASLFIGLDANDVTSLDELSQIVSIGGDLIIRQIDHLESLEGLNNINSIEGYLELSKLEHLIDISALSGLVEIKGGVVIQDNFQLKSIEGLLMEETSTQLIQIYKNFSLEVIEGFDGIQKIEDRVFISQNDNLITIDGFIQLDSSQKDLEINLNNKLRNVNGFESLYFIGDDLYFRNTDVEMVSGFGSLDVVNGSIIIDNNLSLQAIDPIVPRIVGDDLTVADNNGLLQIHSLSNLERIIGELTIADNDVLNKFEASNLRFATGLAIYTNPLLADINFPALDTIKNLLYGMNGQTDDLSGFAELDYAQELTFGIISTQNSFRVESLNGLQGITTLNSLRISHSEVLNSLEGLNNVHYIDDASIFEINALLNLEGLNQLDSLGGMDIFRCENLSSLSGFNNLQIVKDELFIIQNASLTSLTGLEQLEEANTLRISSNQSLTDLNPLQNLTKVDEWLEIKLNQSLIDISGLENIDMVTHLDSLSIESNAILSICNYDNICDYLTTGGAHNISGFQAGCSSLNEVINSCLANQDPTRFQGKVWFDLNLNCETDSSDLDIADVLLRVQSDLYDYTLSADEFGFYDIPVLPDTFTLSVISPSVFWTPCFADTILIATGMNDTIVTDFYLQPKGDCPYIDWTMDLNPLRICGTRLSTLNFCNQGAQPAEDFQYTLDLGPYVTLDSASMPFTLDPDGNPVFEIDSLAIFECQSINLFLFADCDSIEINEILCVDVELSGPELCAPDSLWDGSTTQVSGYCEGDSIYFQLQNIGFGDMSDSAAFTIEIIIEDIVLLFDGGNFQLNSADSILFSYPLLGDGFHLKANQRPGHPSEMAARLTVPNCDSIENEILLTLFPSNNGNPFKETFCTFAVNSYDPNDKAAIPAGLGPEHLIEPDWNLDYTIRYQNTGNDVAYDVVIRDTISEHLDLTTLRVQGATHAFTWALNEDRELVFTFSDINLPDSTSNLIESQGHISYSISPKADILPGTIIRNRAGIYFDFNPPIITNDVTHKIRKPVVQSREILEWCLGEPVQSTPIWSDTILIQTFEFVEYDSVHASFLFVQDEIFTEEMIDVTAGDVFEGILIQNDTTIAITYSTDYACDSTVTYQISAIIVSTNEANLFSDTRIYPNPASDYLIIEGPSLGVTQTWTLMNTLGVPVWQSSYPARANPNQINLQSVPNGVYLLQVQTSFGNKSWKVVIR